MSTWLSAAHLPLTVEFPFDSVEEVTAAVQEYVTEGRVVTFRRDDSDDEVVFNVVADFSRIGPVMVSRVAPEADDPRPVVMAKLDRSPDDDRWEIAELAR